MIGGRNFEITSLSIKHDDDVGQSSEERCQFNLVRLHCFLSFVLIIGLLFIHGLSEKCAAWASDHSLTVLAVFGCEPSLNTLRHTEARWNYLRSHLRSSSREEMR